jgi:hypothetical protein
VEREKERKERDEDGMWGPPWEKNLDMVQGQFVQF